MSATGLRHERGAALVVGLIMLVLITLMLLAALNVGTANFRAVSNMQYREEAISAANRAIEQVISSPFALDPPAAAEISWSTSTTTVTTTTPSTSREPKCVCAQASRRRAASACPDHDARLDVEHGLGHRGHRTAASTPAPPRRVRAGVRALLSGAQKNDVCA